jgi:P4 family phage/plasmid primase-like protien
MEYMGQVFTDPAVKKYMMDVMACIIDGSIRQEKFYIFTGSGSNSKSKMLELLQRAIGDYYCILPIALLTQKRAASNAAQSELERTKGRRFAIMQEPGESEKINIGLMKELSGGDRILTRGLFKDPIEFKPQFTMIMTCNELPEVASDDGGTWRRIRVIAFTSKFVEHPDPKNPLEFPLDGELTDKFDRWADTFMSMLIYHHSQMDPKNIHEPHIVKITTEGYKKNNDLIGQYCEEMVEYNPECDERTQLIKAFMDFKAWVGDISARGCGKKIPDRNQFKAYMEKKYGVYTQKGWKGIILKSSVGDDSDVE